MPKKKKKTKKTPPPAGPPPDLPTCTMAELTRLMEDVPHDRSQVGTGTVPGTY